MITMNRPNTVSQVMHFCFASGILVGLMLMDIIKFQIVCAVTIVTSLTFLLSRKLGQVLRQSQISNCIAVTMAKPSSKVK